MTSSIYIAKSVYGGDGLGRLGDGRVVFVPGAFPGEQESSLEGAKRVTPSIFRPFLSNNDVKHLPALSVKPVLLAMHVLSVTSG